MENTKEDADTENKQFYLRYYVGHTGQFGHEFIEFEVRKDGVLRYANDSQYKRDRLIRKEVRLNDCVVDQFRKLVQESDILQADDTNWPEPNEDGRQELEIVWGKEHIFFVTSKIGSMTQLYHLKADKGLTDLYILSRDLKALVFSLINLHFKIKPM